MTRANKGKCGVLRSAQNDELSLFLPLRLASGIGFAFEPAVQPAHIQVEAEGGVAEHLVEVAHGEVVVADVADGGAGRGVDVEAGVLAELADAEEMGAVGDDDDMVQIVFMGDGGEAVDLLVGIDGAGLGDDVAEGDAVGKEIVAADATFGVAGVLVVAAAEGDDERGDLFAVEINGVVEAGVEGGRGMAGVLGCPEDGDGIGGLGFVVIGHGVDLLVEPDAPAGRDDQHQGEEPTEEDAPGGPRRRRLEAGAIMVVRIRPKGLV